MWWRRRSPSDLREPQLRLLRRVLGQEAHLLSSEPSILASHLHNMLYLDEGDEGAAGALISRARESLSDRAWLQLIGRPPVDRSFLLGALEHGEPIWGIAFSPDGSLLASAGSAGSARIWWTDRRVLAGLVDAGSGEVNDLAWSPDGRLLATAEESGVRLWEAPAWSQLEERPSRQQAVLGVAWSPDGELLAMAGAEGSVGVWRVGSNRQVEEVTRHRGRAYAVAWSPDGGLLASVGSDGHARLWDRRSGRPRKSLVDEELQRATAELIPDSDGADFILTLLALAWSPDGRTLAVASRAGMVRVWDLAAGAAGPNLVGTSGGVSALAWSPDGSCLAGGAGEGLVLLWEAAGWRRLRLPLGHDGPVWGLAWSPDGRILASGSRDGAVRLWRALDYRRQGARRAAELGEGHSTGIFGATWSARGSYLVSAADDALCWNAATGALAGRTGRLTGPVTAISPAAGRGVLMAPMGGRAEADILHWPSPGEEPRLLMRTVGPLFCLSLAPDRRLLAAGDLAGAIWLLDSRAGRELGVLLRPDVPPEKNPVRSLAWSPRGRRLASVTRRASLIWDLETGKPLADLEGCGGRGPPTEDDLELGEGVLPIGFESNALAWSPDGRLLAGSGEGSEIRLWNGRTGALMRTLESHRGRVTTLAWSPDGSLLASGASDCSVRVWEVREGQCRVLARCLSSPVVVRFTRQGGFLQAADDGSATGYRPLPYLFSLRGFCRSVGPSHSPR